MKNAPTLENYPLQDSEFIPTEQGSGFDPNEQLTIENATQEPIYPLSDHIPEGWADETADPSTATQNRSGATRASRQPARRTARGAVSEDQLKVDFDETPDQQDVSFDEFWDAVSEPDEPAGDEQTSSVYDDPSRHVSSVNPDFLDFLKRLDEPVQSEYTQPAPKPGKSKGVNPDFLDFMDSVYGKGIRAETVQSVTDDPMARGESRISSAEKLKRRKVAVYAWAAIVAGMQMHIEMNDPIDLHIQPVAEVSVMAEASDSIDDGLRFEPSTAPTREADDDRNSDPVLIQEDAYDVVTHDKDRQQMLQALRGRGRQ